MNAVSTEVVPFQQMERMAIAVAKSGMFGARTPEQAMALMLMAQAEGVHPARAMQEYHVIQGRPALKADAMLARFQAAGGRVTWEKHTDDEVVGVFAHPQAGAIRIDWSLERAKKAGLTGKDTWKAYPRQMLRARVISEGVRATFPGIAVGTYSAEEVADMEPVNVTPAKVEAAIEQAVSARPLTESEIEDHMICIREAPDADALRAAFASAWKHATEAKDEAAKNVFKLAYDNAKGPAS